MATEKRARKKQHRDQRQAARLAALRRRRVIRLTAVLVVLAVVVSLGLSFGAGDDDGGSGNDATATESPTVPTGEVACGGDEPPPANPKEYERPEEAFEPGVDYGAVIQTSCGRIELDLFEDDAPETVNNFVFLAREGYFDGLTWHRIVGNFVIQSGDPDGVPGPGAGPGYAIDDELPERSNVYTFGTVAMANSGANTGGSQFFIVTHQGPEGETNVPAGLTPDYAVFGKVGKSSFAVVEEIGKIPTFSSGENPELGDVPRTPVYIESVEIVES